MLIIINVVMCRIGKLHVLDLGIDLSRLFTGAIAVLSVWLLSARAGMLIGLGMRGSLFLDDWWYEHGATYIVGLLLCRLFGGTLKEELIFRGFLLNQLFFKLRSHFPVGSKKTCEISKARKRGFFALAHIPCQLRKCLPLRDYPIQMVCLFAHGVGFAFIYHRTDNLLIAVRVHSLVCTPLSLFLPQTAGSMIVMVTGLMLVLSQSGIEG
jgi:membrane protease YdiL (CAAX protease family)